MSQPIRKTLPALLIVAAAGFGAIVSPSANPASAADAQDKKVVDEASKAADGKKAADEKKAKATFEVYKDRAGEYRWRLRSMNKQVLASSGEGYKEKRDCLAAIESVKRAAAEAPVVEEQPAGS